MSEYSHDNKRIAKNTMLLYMRMILIMAITLYSSRITLSILGIEDFGIYNLIAGVVLIFSLITNTISAGTSRFFAFEIGVGNYAKLSQYFKISIILFVLVAILIMLLAETMGVWFVENKLTIPPNRYDSVSIVYQFSVISFIVGLFSIPYKSLIIAHEKMDFYAYVGIIEVLLNLGLLFLLKILSFDKLSLYAILTSVVTLLITLIYYIYCRINFDESRFSYFWDKKIFIEFSSYSGWIIVGGLSSICSGQGLNVLLNVFFGPTVNAARGIAYQVQSAVNQFASNFYMACRPQITKLYASGQRDEMMKLVFSSSRMCYLLTIIFFVPLFIEAPYILKLWLTIIPEYSIIFTRVVLCTITIETISYPLQAAITATGKVKWYQFITGGITILTLPVAYILLKNEFGPTSVFYTLFILAILAQITRIYFMKTLLNMPLERYFKEVVIRVCMVTILSPIVPYVLHCFLNETFINVVITILFSLISTVFISLYFGITKDERSWIACQINKYANRFFETK